MIAPVPVHSFSITFDHSFVFNYRLIVATLLCLAFLLTTVSAVAWWLMPRTPDPKVGGSSPTRVKPCCVLEQGTFTPQKALVIPRKQWLRPYMTEKLFTGTLRINQSTNLLTTKKQNNAFFLQIQEFRVVKISSQLFYRLQNSFRFQI